MRRSYENPPIQEAVCEIRFAEGPGADVTLGGRVFAELRAEYPAKPKDQPMVEAEVSEVLGAQQVQIRQTGRKIQLSNDDGTRMVSIAPTLLSVHALKPYRGWEEFRDRLRRAYEAFVAAAQPPAVTRIGVRFIDHISIPAGFDDARRLVSIPMNPLPGVLPNPAAFLLRSEHATDDHAMVLLTIATARTDPAGLQDLVLAVDVDSIWEDKGSPLEIGSALERVETLKARVTDTFESLITDAAREMFGVVD